LEERTIKESAYTFSDYYEVLQLSPNADSDTIDRVYRILAKRYHPDNQDTGNAETFGLISEAHRVLSNPERRAAYDVRYEENRASVLKIFDEASASDSFSGDQRIFEGVLSLLYISRRRDAHHGGMGVIQLERLLGCPAQHLEFHIWYLLQKGWIERLDGGQLSITAHGVDRVIAQDNLMLRRDRLLGQRTSTDDQSSPSPKEEFELLT
jgi:curved DNA-binding protein